MASPTVLIPLAEGAEEIEVVVPADVLRRAGAEVTIAGLAGGEAVRCSRGIRLVPDRALGTGEQADLVVLPGGTAGARALAADPRVLELLRRQEAAERGIAAICAAPIALVAAGTGRGRTLTSHPSVRAEVEGFAGRYAEEAVAEDGLFVTARGPAASFAFAFALVRRLFGPEKALEVERPMMPPQSAAHSG